MDYEELYPGKFLKAGLFKGRDVTLTIQRVILEVLEGDKGKERRGILVFAETERQLVLNKTNGICLKGMFGRETDAWVGKQVTLYPTEVMFGTTKDLGIRVRGSPDLPRNIEVEIKLAKKKPRKVVMEKTPPRKGKGNPLPETPAAEPPRAPPPETNQSPADEPPADVLLPGQKGYAEP